MKKCLILLLLSCASISYSSFGAPMVHILDFKNSELDILVNLNEQDSSFKEYYSFQYDEGTDFSFLSRYANFYLINATEKELILKCDQDTIHLQIGKSDNPNTYSGYGLSKRKADRYTLHLIPGKTQILDLININGHDVAFKGLNCSSGGQGSTSCSVEGSFLGSSSCSVSCGSGYYACCDGDANICKCIAYKALKVKLSTYTFY